MTEKKAFWSSVPGMVTGIASIVTGLAVLIPVLIGISHGKKEGDRNASAANPTATSTVTPSPSTSGSDTSTATPDSGLATDSATPGPGESGSPGATPGPSLAAAPPTVDFGHVTLSSSPGPQTVTLTNQSSNPLTLDKVAIGGPNASAFGIASTTCGQGTVIPPQGSCQVSVRYTPTHGAQTASLVMNYQGASTTVTLTGNASLL